MEANWEREDTRRGRERAVGAADRARMGEPGGGPTRRGAEGHAQNQREILS